MSTDTDVILEAHTRLANDLRSAAWVLASEGPAYLRLAAEMRVAAIKGEPIPAETYRACLLAQEAKCKALNDLDQIARGVNELAAFTAAIAAHPSDLTGRWSIKPTADGSLRAGWVPTEAAPDETPAPEKP